MKKNRFPKARLFLLLSIMLLGSCTPMTAKPSQNGDLNGKVIESNLVRLTNLQVLQSDQQALSDGNRAFTVNLYQKLRAGDGNLIFSPYSISLALAMVSAGARGDTASQIAAAMHFTLPPDQLHPAFNALDGYLASLGVVPKPTQPAPTDQGGQDFRLKIANSIWGQVNFSFLPAYLDLLAQNYGAGLRVVDFSGAPETSRQAINNWVSQQTEDKIKDLFPQGAIDSNTRLALVNAIYFKASWMIPFEETATKTGVFHLKDGSQVSVPMMTSGYSASTYEKGDGFQAVGLPYLDQKTMMVIVLPDEGKFDQFEAGLDIARLTAILNGLQGNHVNLTLPKFKIESSFSLNKMLGELGMPAAFDASQADFSEMDGRRDLFISQAVHKAYVAVDEKGTEAAAATGIAMATAAILNPPEVKVDRPFLFFIYEQSTSTVLFAGRVLNPIQ